MRKSNGSFLKLDHDLMRTDAWVSLTPGEMALLIFIWSRHNGRNNGEIGCGRREIQQRFGCASHTAVKWLKALQDKGFMVATRRGSFNQKTGGGRTTRWRLTMEPYDGKSPTREYLAWRPQTEGDQAENPKRGFSGETNSGFSEGTNATPILVH